MLVKVYNCRQSGMVMLEYSCDTFLSFSLSLQLRALANAQAALVNTYGKN